MMAQHHCITVKYLLFFNVKFRKAVKWRKTKIYMKN